MRICSRKDLQRKGGTIFRREGTESRDLETAVNPSIHTNVNINTLTMSDGSGTVQSMNDAIAIASRLPQMAIRLAATTGLSFQQAEQTLLLSAAFIALGQGCDLDAIDQYTKPYGFKVPRR